MSVMLDNEIKTNILLEPVWMIVVLSIDYVTTLYEETEFQ